MTGRFRVPGVHSLTASALGKIRVDTHAQSLLGKGTVLDTAAVSGVAASLVATSSSRLQDAEERSTIESTIQDAGSQAARHGGEKAVAHAQTGASKVQKDDATSSTGGASTRRAQATGGSSSYASDQPVDTGPVQAKAVRSTASQTGIVARNNQVAAQASTGGGRSVGYVAGGQRVATQVSRGTAQSAARALSTVTKGLVGAAKGVAVSPVAWVIAGVAALVLLIVVVVGAFVSGAGGGLSSGGGGSMCQGETSVPPQGQEWVAVASESSGGLPAWWLARIISRESDWDPTNFTPDSNGGTWGLFQINRSEWARLHPETSGQTSGTPAGITDPLIHSEAAGRLLREHYDHFEMQKHLAPGAAWAQLDPLEAVVIMHNAGQGALMRYPNIPAITKDYVAEVMATGGEGGGGVWTHPAPNASQTSPFGWRVHPVYGTLRLHSGTDFSAGAGSPTHAANSGVVTFAGFDSNDNGTIKIDHGGGIETKYLHMYADGIYVREGQAVVAGQVIGAEGSSGQSTGAHLHFEVLENGTPIDAVPFLAEHLGQAGGGLIQCGVVYLGDGGPVVEYAMSFQGVPYVYGGETPSGFDCSGLMQYVYSHFGVSLPRTSNDQAYAGQNVLAGQGSQADMSKMMPGDLIAFSKSGGANYQHVGMYIGGGQMVHAPKPGDVVKTVGLDWYTDQVWRVQRVAVGGQQ